ncbi:hypothetical protein [Parasitella parasitica]|uniref:Fanconi anemia group D2 protein n=1 Tax=Parasitella parasitica TaxID=35722 RepID=A0A0B7NA30_9FUNG|nr:hypothetical protein [Parasitella parasitica]
MSLLDLLRESGCSIESDGVIFTIEPVLFRRKLSSRLRAQPQAAEAFFKDIQDNTEDPLELRKLLLPSKMNENVPLFAFVSSSSSDSLFKTLLAIDSIQPDLITYLLERLPEFYDELENDHSSSCTARLILHQLRWLDYIVQPEALTGKLIEIIQITPLILQHEIITSLPDIVNDSEHKPIVVFLKELMNDNGDLTVAILDALSNLTLHSESLEDVRETVLDRLESADLDDLPVIIKFLLQTVTPITIDQVVWGIRQKLNFRSLGTNQSQTKTTNAPEALILESIKLGLQFHKFVCDSWFRAIIALETKRDHKLVDMMVLIILYSMTSMKKKVEGAVKKKITQGYITGPLVQETILNHPDGLAGYWGTILSLAESLLRAGQQNNKLSPCASAMYISAFKSTDAYYRQEIIGALVTHIGSGVEVEMNVALNVLLELVNADVSSVVVYSVFIKGILDYLDNLNDFQIRTLFDIFSLLALTTGTDADGSGNLWSEIQTITRKQLSSPREKYKCIGIIASLSAVKVLGSKKLCLALEHQHAEAGGSSSTQISRAASAQTAERHPLLQKATELLDFALRSAGEHTNCIKLIYDDLAHMIQEQDIDERLQLWVKENMTSDFTEFYMASVADADAYIQESRNNGYLKLEPDRQMELDQSEITVKMFELLHNNLDPRKKKAQIAPMCSIFHLIQSCEKKLNNGSLEEVDALFGCSVVLFDGENLDDLSTEEIECACDMLFYTINWFKELLNAFMFSTEEENYRTRLIERLRNILLMESLLEHLMKQVPNYAPLEFYNIDTMKTTTANTAFTIGDNTSQSTVDETTKKKSNNSNNTAVKPHASIKLSSIQDLRSYTRAFDVHVLELLRYSEQVQDNDTKLVLKEIDYLLQDIEQKLDIKVSPPPAAYFGKKKVDKHQQDTCNFIMLARIDARQLMKQARLGIPTRNVTVIGKSLYRVAGKEPGYIDGSEQLVECITRIFDIILKLISWPNIEIADNRDILMDIIQVIAERVSGKDPQQAFEYLSNYIVGIPKATTAVLLYKILLRFKALFSDIDNKYALKVVNQIVSTDWFDWRDIQKEIPFLFEESIEKNPASLSLLSDFVNTKLPQYEQDGALQEYPLLKSDTINQHYQTVKALDLLKDTDQDAEIILTQTAQLVKIFERLTDYVKTKENRTLMGVLLKAGRTFVDQFTKHSIPYFSSVFKEHSPSILGIFKDLQSSTRMLQSAFFMGALKHRDIRGTEVSSQIPRDLSSSSEEDKSDDEGVELEAIEEEDEQEDEPDAQEKKLTKAKKAAAPKRKRNSSSSRKQTKTVQISYRTSSVVPSSSDEDEEDSGVKRKRASRKIQNQEEDAEEEEEEEEEENQQDDVIVFTDGDLQSDLDEPMDEDGPLEDKEAISPPPSLSPSPSPSPPPPPPPSKKPSASKRGSLGLSKSTKTFNLSRNQ